MKKILIISLCLIMALNSCKKDSELKEKIIEAQNISLNKTDRTLSINDELQLIASILPENTSNKKITWSSSDEAIATISDTGLVKAISYGEIILKATTNNNKTVECKILIKPDIIEATGITITNNSFELNIGETQKVNATVLPSNTTNKSLKWLSLSLKIATIDENGIITAVGEGTTIGYVKTSNMKIAQFTIKVNNAISPINPVTFTNTSDHTITAAFMGTEETFCEINGEVHSIKEELWVPEKMRTSKSFDEKSYLVETAKLQHAIKDELDPSEFQIEPGQSVKLYDQSKISYIYIKDVSSDDCDFSGMTGLMYIYADRLSVPTLDFSNSPNMDIVLLQFSSIITKVDISKCTKLQYYTVAETEVGIADFTNCPIIKHVALVGGKTKKIDLSNCPKVGMNVFGSGNAAHFALKEVTLCPEMNEFGNYWASVNYAISKYSKDFIFKFHINTSPNSFMLPKNQKQVIDCLGKSGGLEFDDCFCVEFQEGEPLWTYDKESKLWKQKTN